MESVELVSKVQDLLVSKKQIFSRLTDGEGSFCFEGIVSLAYGWTEEGNGMIDENGRRHSHLGYHHTFPFNKLIPAAFILKQQGKLSLTPRQIKLISAKSFYNWVGLNDEPKFSFQQFSILIDLMMKEEDVVEV